MISELFANIRTLHLYEFYQSNIIRETNANTLQERYKKA